MARWSLALSCLLLGGLVGVFVAGPYLHGGNALQGPAPTMPKELSSYRDVVKHVLPAVVSIEATAKPKARQEGKNPRRQQLPDDPRLPEEFRKFLEEFGRMPSEPDDMPHHGFGSGFIVDPSGVVLTNYHVVEGCDTVDVILGDGRKLTSKDIKTDRKTDLAIVRIEAKDLPHLELGDSDAMEIGDRVLAVGAPFGLTGSVTSGIVSAKGRNGLHMNFYEDFLQTDAAINPGNSGGPLVNLEGKVIGINAAIKSRTGGFQGIGLAIASNMAKKIMPVLLKEGVVRRGYLGVQIQDLDEKVAAKLGVKQHTGVVVNRVFDSAPAGKAGLKEGDVVTAIDGKEVKDGRELQQVVAGLPLNKPVQMNVLRDGKKEVLSVTIEEQPEDFDTVRVPAPRTPSRNRDAVEVDKFGVEVADLTPEMAEELGFSPKTKGVLVTRVEEDSAAATAGLRRGMVIAKVDKAPVNSAADLRDLLNKAGDNGVLLQVQSAREGTRYVVVKPEAAAKK